MRVCKNCGRYFAVGKTMKSEYCNNFPDEKGRTCQDTGAIAAWEANLRFLEDGRFGQKKARLFVSQNKPFIPMYNAWKQDSRALLPYDADQARKDAAEICAPVLSNRKPPYSLAGGLYDALKDTQGDILAVSNDEANAAKQLFEETEGIDIYHAAAVAVASLIQAINNKVNPDDIIMLNITGGGEKHFMETHEIFHLEPSHIFPIGFTKEDVGKVMEGLMKN